MEALLIELDPAVAERARTTAAGLGLFDVEVRVADAGVIDTYLEPRRADVLLASGVFGNLTPEDVRRTVATLPAVLASHAVVVWTRSCGPDGPDPSVEIRDCFARHGFSEVSFSSTPDGVFRVGVHRLAAGSGTRRPPKPGTRMFAFASPVPPGTWPVAEAVAPPRCGNFA